MNNNLNYGSEEVNKIMQEIIKQKTVEFSRIADEDKKRFEEEQSRKKIGSSTNAFIEGQKRDGKIINQFARNYLEGKITQARLTLAIAMAITLLFEHQWFLWIIFIITYNVYVNKLRAEVSEYDNERYKK